MPITVTGGHRVSLGDGDHSVYALRPVKIQAGHGENQFDLRYGGKLTLAGDDSVLLRYGNLKISESGHAFVTMAGGGSAVIDQGSMTMQNAHFYNIFQAASGQTTMIGGAGLDVFRFDARGLSGHHTIQNFQIGVDKLVIPRHSLAILSSHGEIREENGNTIISMHNGATSIELIGVTGLHATDLLRH